MNNLSKIALIAISSVAVVGSVALAESGKRGGGFVFEEVDTDANGFVTIEELQAMQTARFEARDTDGDGFLTEEEIAAGYAAKAEETGREFNTERLNKRIARTVRGLDIDNDGKVSAEEANTRDVSKFVERLDTDGDGKISVAEMEAGKAKFKEKRENRKG